MPCKVEFWKPISVKHEKTTKLETSIGDLPALGYPSSLVLLVENANQKSQSGILAVVSRVFGLDGGKVDSKPIRTLVVILV